MPDGSRRSISSAVEGVARLRMPASSRAYAGIDSAMAPSRAALCAALDAIAPHRDAVTVAGAHAVFERTRDLDIAADATKDGDLALTPALVAEEPRLEAAMRGAGFRTLAELEGEARKHDPGLRRRYEAQPGLWATGMATSGDPIGEVDLLVPTSIAGGGRRSARALKSHGKQATRHTPGLELVVLDRSLMKIENFVDGSVRDAWVAGYAGLLCAKAYKLGERIHERDGNGRDRVRPKDAVDVWRLLATSDGVSVSATFDQYSDHEQCGEAVHRGRRYLETIIGDGHIRALATADLAVFVPPDEVGDTISTWFRAFRA